MAHMFPRNGPQVGTKSRYEVEIYFRLKHFLDDRFFVFHDIRFATDPHDRKRNIERESDFIIFHPEYGIFIIEVKGAHFNHDQHNNIWLTAKGNTESPIEQARAEKYALDHHFKKNSHTRNFASHIRTRFAVWLVNNGRKNFELPEISDKCLFFAEDYLNENPMPVIQQLMEYYGKQGVLLSKQQSESIYQAIAPRLEIKLNVPLQIAETQQKLQELTEEQYRVFTQTYTHLQMLIPGYAGTGKTLLAYISAWHYAQEGQRVLLICHSIQLATFLRNLYESDALPNKPTFLIHTPQTLVKEYFALAHRNLQNIKPAESLEMNKPQHQGELAGRLRNSVKTLRMQKTSDWQFDAMFIDEGQDFEPVLLDALFELMRDPEKSRYYVFFDEAQRVIETKNKGRTFTEWVSQKTSLFTTSPLTINCRNSREIFHFMQEFNPLRQQQIESYPQKGPEGIKPLFIPLHRGKLVSRSAVEVAELRVLLQDLIVEQQIVPRKILVITFSSEKDSYLESQRSTLNEEMQGFKLGGINNVPAFRSENIVPFLSIGSAKGLESDVVILTELEGIYTRKIENKDLDRNVYPYIAASRCRYKLIILGDEHELYRRPLRMSLF